jgi:hypothetical protein
MGEPQEIRLKVPQGGGRIPSLGQRADSYHRYTLFVGYGSTGALF